MPAKRVTVAKHALIDAIKSEIPKGPVKKTDPWKVGVKDGMKRVLEIIERQQTYLAS
jgi:hypothetical protein